MKKQYITLAILVLSLQGISLATTTQSQIPTGVYLCPDSCVAERSTYFHYLTGCNAQKAAEFIQNGECTYTPKAYNTYICKYQKGNCTIVTDTDNKYKSAKCNSTELINQAIEDARSGKCELK